MRIIYGIYHRLRRYEDSLMRCIYRLRAHWRSNLCHGTLDWPNSTAAAVPVRVDGAGHVSLGERVILGFRPAPCIGSGEILLQARGRDSRISIGARSATNNNVSIVAMQSITIGEDCRIGDLVTILDCDFHEINPATRGRSPGKTSPIKIGSNVWLGSRVMVLKGVTIGDNTVVAAASVVTKSLPPNIVAAGIPAVPVRKLSSNS